MTFYALSIRIFLKDKGDPRSFTLITTFFGALVLIFLVPFEKISFSSSLPILIILPILALLFSVTDLVFIIGRKLEEVSIVSLFV